MFHIYGLIVGIAIVAGWSVAERIESKVNKVLPWVIIGGIVGARLYHVVDLWEYYGQNPAQILAVWNGGLGILGGILGGVIGLQIYQFTNESINQWKIMGAIVTGLPLSQAIGRWGNYFNDELWGVGGKPIFLYESLLNLGLFILTLTVPLKKRVGTYLIGYGLIRFCLEFYRVDPWVIDWYFAGAMILVGVVLLCFNKKGGQYDGSQHSNI